jgi:hypothetical protein
MKEGIFIESPQHWTKGPLMGREGQPTKSDCHDAYVEVVISRLWAYHPGSRSTD